MNVKFGDDWYKVTKKNVAVWFVHKSCFPSARKVDDKLNLSRLVYRRVRYVPLQTARCRGC